VHVKHEAYDVVDNVEDHGAVQRVCRGHDHRVLRVRASLPLHRERERERERALKNLLGFVIDLKMSFRRECSLSIFGEFFILLLLLLLLLFF
jgi:hypothetical protein